MRGRLKNDLTELMRIPGLSGHEDRVRKAIARKLGDAGVESRSDRLGNLIASFPGEGPAVMLFTHMDQLGFVVRKIEDDGFIRIERLGGVPERALLAQAVLFAVEGAPDVPGVIACKSHHATLPEEKYSVPRVHELFIDTGHDSREAVEAAGIRIGTPATYLSRVLELAGGRVAGTSVDDRAGCAVLIEVARALAEGRKCGPPVHVVFSVQEEFNLRGAVVAAQALRPEIALQVDLMNASDAPGMADRGEMELGSGPGMSLYSFHGRGTLNGVIPHPALVRLFERVARELGLTLQRSAQTGVLTDLSYVQLVGEGVASLDLGFPMRYSHSGLEVCDPADLEGLARLLLAALPCMGPDLALDRDSGNG